MPLVRVQVRNEYGLGRPELCRGTNSEDPKVVLDGVVVAGLVGILRQLGDLADFAAEVFHGLQEQVLTTASRSRKLMLRAQNIEASLPSLEKAILAQTSHIHFAYTAGCEWHSRAKPEQNHFIYNDLPQFIMDSYEECRDPPCLHFLDKFDPGGHGSCLRRYSDPTFFRRVSADSDEAHIKKTERSRKTSRSKKKRSRRNGETLQGEQMHGNGGRKTSSSQTADVVLESDLEDHCYSVDSRVDVGHRKSLSRRNGETLQGEQMHSNVSRQTSSSQTADVVLESDLKDHSYCVDSRADAGYIECVFQPSNSVQFDEQECKESPSSRLTQKTDALQLASPAIDYNFSQGSFDKQIASTSTGLTWDEKEEIVDSESQWCNRDELVEVLDETHNLHMHEDEPVAPNNSDQSDFLYGEERNLKPVSSTVQTDETDSEPDNFLDALYTIESECENDLDCETKEEAGQLTSHVSSEVMENGVGATSTVLDHDFYNIFSHTISSVSSNKETDLDSPETLQEIPLHISEGHVTSLRNPVQSDVPENIERTKILVASYGSESPIHELVPDMCGNSVLDCSVGTNPLDDTCSLNDTMSSSIETVPSNAPVNIESKRDLVDSHGSGGPTHEQANYILGCSIDTNPLDVVHILDDAVPVSIEPVVQSNVIVNRERTESLGDASEYPIGEQVPHIRGNSVFDNAHNDSLSASSENVEPDGFVNSETTNNLADTHAPQSPIHEQMSRVCSVFDNAHNNDSLSASSENVRPYGFVNSETTKNLADTHAPQSPIHEQMSRVCSVFDNAHNDSLSASSENVRPYGFVNSETTKNLADSHAPQSPIHEQVSHVCSVSDNAHNYSLSASSENVRSDCCVNSETTKNLAVSHAPQSPIHEQVSRTRSVSDNAHNDSLSTSIENVRQDGFVNSEMTKSLADSHAPQSPIHEQVSHVCGNSVLECSVGTIPLGDYPTVNESVSASSEIDPSDDAVNFEKTMNLADSHGSASAIHEKLPHISGNSVLKCLGGTNPLGDAHTLHDTVSASIETDISSSSKSSDLPDKEADSIDSNVYKSKETPSEPASDPSVGLWTNGGLLGLEPSKPPDFVIPSSLNQGFMTSTNDTDGVLNHNSVLKSNGYREELNQKEPSSRRLVSQCDDQACISGKTSNCHWQSSRHGQNDEDFDKNRVPTPGTVLPVAHTSYTEPSKGNGLNSPLLFGLGHKLLVNSFYRRVSFDEKSGPDNSVKAGLLEQSGQNSTVQESLPETTFKEEVSYDYPICSPPPSPPLEHMKISFCPVDGFETFKLKLKFPDVSDHSESTRDMFPSFRLVPEHSVLVHDSGSNSDDDDTFCQSVSNDCLHPHSDYNSDQWESDDTPDIIGDGVYESSHRISESNSSSQEVRGGTNVDIDLDSKHIMLTQDSAEPSFSGHLLDFPSFNTMKPVIGRECNKHSVYDNSLKLQGHAESIPPAPPLPPNQWWLSNQRSDMMNEKQNCSVSRDTEQINDSNISESTLQVRPTPVKQNPTDHEDHGFNEDIPRKLRDKSFNQKHAVTGKPNDITSPTTTDRVAAILEKANAIRQVISSDDDEDDDRWSEI